MYHHVYMKYITWGWPDGGYQQPKKLLYIQFVIRDRLIILFSFEIALICKKVIFEILLEATGFCHHWHSGLSLFVAASLIQGMFYLGGIPLVTLEYLVHPVTSTKP